MRKLPALTIFIFVFCLQFTLAYGQKKKKIQAPMTPDHWEVASGKVQFTTHLGKASMKLSNDSGDAILKDHVFSNGTIEFDVAFNQSVFVGIDFRRQGKESEFFYIRSMRMGDSIIRDAIQYAPKLMGINLWDMLDQYQGPANMKSEGWNHFKLVVFGKQMRVYVNDMQNPALVIPEMMGSTMSGAIHLVGSAFFANLSIHRGQTEDLSPLPGYDPTQTDTRYLRTWEISDPQVLPQGRTPVDIPGDTATWKPIRAERLGLINVTRLYGGSQERKLVWLKTKLHSDSKQKKKLDFGFSDDVWVLINKRLLYVDQNAYGAPIMKEPDGRCSIENTSFILPLEEGENEILIGLANNFFGWGIVARLEDLKGVQIIR